MLLPISANLCQFDRNWKESDKRNWVELRVTCGYITPSRLILRIWSQITTDRYMQAIRQSSTEAIRRVARSARSARSFWKRSVRACSPCLAQLRKWHKMTSPYADITGLLFRALHTFRVSLRPQLSSFYTISLRFTECLRSAVENLRELHALQEIIRNHNFLLEWIWLDTSTSSHSIVRDTLQSDFPPSQGFAFSPS